MTSAGSGAVALTWYPPTPIPGQWTITGYRATAYTSSSGTQNDGTCTTQDPEGLSCVIDGLTDGETYWFSVLARTASGDGTPTQRVSFQLPSLGGYSDVTTGAFHTCALETDGDAWCWGDNLYGQLGDGTLGDPISVPTAVLMPTGAGGFTSIDAGGDTTCAIASTGDIWCWGSNGQGQMGIGETNTESSGTPLKIQMPQTGSPPSDVNFTQVSVGSEHACARTDGGILYCWGNGQSGQLGNLMTETAVAPVAVTTFTIALPQTYKRVSAGDTHTCAIASDDTAWCWGDGNGGALGLTNADGFYTEPSAITTGNGIPATWSSISAGLAYSCAVAANGTAWCWGTESNGELGDDGAAQATQYVAVPVTTGAPRPSAYTVAVAGDYHSCALSAGDAAWCWGTDALGQLGNSTGVTGDDQPVPVPVDVSGPDVPDTFDDIDVGAEHTCALDPVGRVWCWGSDSSGQLGNGGTCEASGADCTRPTQALSPGGGSQPLHASSACALDCSRDPSDPTPPTPDRASRVVGAMGIILAATFMGDRGARIELRRRRRPFE